MEIPQIPPNSKCFFEDARGELYVLIGDCRWSLTSDKTNLRFIIVVIAIAEWQIELKRLQAVSAEDSKTLVGIRHVWDKLDAEADVLMAQIAWKKWGAAGG